ncbi:MAG: hypothetical protein Q8R78_04255, partial [Candidatus Omnitrophota bacterium]|nr:hypothetical protein [Candidatus Omnitrophota bacterium]
SALRTQLHAKLAEGPTGEEAWRIAGLEPLSPKPFTRTEPIEGVGSVPAANEAAFAAATGELTDVVETPSGFMVLLVQERLAADAAGLTEEERTRLRGQLENERQQAHLVEWMQDVRERANLKSYLDHTTEPQNSTETQRAF